MISTSRRSFILSGTAFGLAPALTGTLAAQMAGIYIDCSDGWLYFQDYVFPVVLPREQFRLPVSGMVVRTDFRPTWWPTPNTRSAYFREHGRVLPEVIPYGHPLNALGEGRIVIDFDQPWMRQPPMNWIRIHGNARQQDLHRSLSRGCFRLRDQDIITLMYAIDRQPVFVYMNIQTLF